MRQDVVDLTRFYAGSLGGAARAMVARRLDALWPDVRDLDVLGLGYATPFLDAARAQARRVVAAMPADQGVERWPSDGKTASVLVEEARLPFKEALFDRALLVHLVEDAEALRPLLREVWRVTAPNARVAVVAPNRIGLWARSEASPFGHGRAFTRRQLTTVLSEAMFEPVAWSRALYLPPVSWGWLVKTARAWERTGETLMSGFGGVILVEAVKRVVAETPKGKRRLVFAPAAARRDDLHIQS